MAATLGLPQAGTPAHPQTPRRGMLAEQQLINATQGTKSKLHQGHTPPLAPVVLYFQILQPQSSSCFSLPLTSLTTDQIEYISNQNSGRGTTHQSPQTILGYHSAFKNGNGSLPPSPRSPTSRCPLRPASPELAFPPQLPQACSTLPAPASLYSAPTPTTQHSHLSPSVFSPPEMGSFLSNIPNPMLSEPA